jgi:transposase
VVVADECKFFREPNRFYRWNRKGTTPLMRVDRKREGTSFYGGLSLKTKREICYITKEHQTSIETCKFLDEVKKNYSDHQGKILLIWDGAKHHQGEVKKWLERNPNILELDKFPPYCPELNPQEHVWKAVRAELSTVVHRYSYSEIIDMASFLLKTNIFDYDFGFKAVLG